MTLDLDALRRILIWALVFDYAVLLIWFAALVFAHDRVYRLHSRWFRMSPETFDTVHYGAMAAYKVGTLLFIVGPLIGVLAAS